MDKPFSIVVIGLATFITLGALATSSLKNEDSEGGGARASRSAGPEVERGRYLVEEVGKCPECHTPRNDRGELRRDAWLSGAPIWIKPIRPIQNWADHAPALAGLPSFTDAQMERVLEKGTGPEGEELRPPMHIYHLKGEDAKAIIAYLKSLPRSASPS
jgi:mono/diheme cytochrome c family protein